MNNNCFTVPLNDQYTVNDTSYFTFYNSQTHQTFRDINKDLMKLTISNLKDLAKFLHLHNYSNLNKQNLLDFITPHIQFE